MRGKPQSSFNQITRKKVRARIQFPLIPNTGCRQAGLLFPPTGAWPKESHHSTNYLAYSQINATHQLCEPKPQPPPALSAAFSMLSTLNPARRTFPAQGFGQSTWALEMLTAAFTSCREHHTARTLGKKDLHQCARQILAAPEVVQHFLEEGGGGRNSEPKGYKAKTPNQAQ